MSTQDPCAAIAAVVTTVEPGLEYAAVMHAITDTLRQRPVQRQVAQLVQADPELLTSGRAEGPRSIERLIRALIGCGAVNVALPRCTRCGHARPLQATGEDGRRICGRCTERQRAKAEPCANCGNHRTIAHRDRLGRPRCAYCPPRNEDPHDTITRVLSQIGLEPTRDQMARVLASCTSKRAQQLRLAWALEDDPALLTGKADSGPLIVVKFIEALIGEGVAAVMPPCPLCGQYRRLSDQLDGRRCCRACRAKARVFTGECSGCQKVKQITAKDSDGRPLCHRCRWSAPEEQQPCGGCGKTAPVHARVDGVPMCDRCRSRPSAVCSICGETRPCYRASTDAPRCERCSRRQRLTDPVPCAGCGRTARTKGHSADGEPLCDSCARPFEPCVTCGQVRYVQGRTGEGQALCRYCYRKHPVARRACGRCRAVGQIHRHGLCLECGLTDQLQALLTHPGQPMRPELVPMFNALRSQPAPAMLNWSRQPRTKAVLAALLESAGVIGHDTLDQLPAHVHTVAHLRGILVTAGVLPPRDEYLASLERWTAENLARIAATHERAITTQYVTWQHLRRLRRRSERTAITYAQDHAVRTEVRAIIGLLAWLSDHGRSLATCRQTDLDAWLTDGPIRRYAARGFVSWAVTRHYARGVQIPATSRDAIPPFIANDQRWGLLRKLLHDDEVELADRVAGLLVLLFAQPCSRIVCLTTNDVRAIGDEATLAIGSKPVTLPTPVSDLVVRLARQHAETNADTPPWLFPGHIAGRHRSAETLSARLNALGIRIRPARNTTMLDLASEVPAAVLSHLLGLHVRTTTDWVHLSGAWGAEYAAEVSRREALRKK